MALTLLPQFLETYEFVNADEIARGLNPLNPSSANIMAGRMMIERMNSLTEAKASFAFETTCAGQHHLRTLQRCAEAGYKTHLLFLWLPAPEIAIDRVAWRVKQGGHDIPADTIRRRYLAGLRNLISLYLPLVNKAIIFDGSSDICSEQGSYAVLAEKNEAGKILVYNDQAWQKTEQTSKEEPHA